MKDEVIARRAQDVQTGLRDVDDPVVSSTIPVTSLIGMAALLAVHIRGLDVIENVPAFYGFAASLGISGHALPDVLRQLEAVAWVRVVPNVRNIKSIEESVPIFQSLYATLGQQWRAAAPGELEDATLALIEALATAPQPLDVALQSAGLDSKDFTRLIDIGELGGYLRQYESPLERRKILYTPLFMDQHPERVLNFLAKHNSRYDDIVKVYAQAKQSPGLPVAELTATHPIVVEMIDANVISAPAVVSSGGRHSFLFPQFQSSRDPAIVTKAKTLLACVRYGERFSTITSVADPKFLLQRLRDTKLIGRKPHSNIGTQYRPAADLGIGYIESVGDRFTFHLYDTDDNTAAVDAAIELASGVTEQPAQRLIQDDEVKRALKDEVFSGIVLPAANRATSRSARAKRRLDPASQTARQMSAMLLDDLRGVRRVT